MGVSPKDDVIFKMIFGNPKHPRILIHFLNCVIKGKSPIEEVSIAQNELTPEYIGQKGTRLDISAKTKDKEIINIEIQRRDEGNMTARSLFYWSKLFSAQLEVSEDYNNLKRTISIIILDFDLFKTDTRYWRKNYILDVESNEKLTDLLEIHFLELNKMREIKEESPLTFWLEFLRNPYSEKVTSLCKFVPEIREAKEVFERVQSDPEAMEYHRLREKSIRDQVNALNHAKSEGKAEGKAEGKKETAINLLRMGLSVEQIAQATGLSAEEVKALK
jgi:predicted transposase/invertase (TIGR01784 family)